MKFEINVKVSINFDLLFVLKTIGSGGVQHDESPEEGVQVENFFVRSELISRCNVLSCLNEFFFGLQEADGGLLEMEEYPGKCLSVSDNSNDNEISLIDCNQFDSNQLFDHTDLLVNFLKWTPKIQMDFVSFGCCK